MGVWEDLKVLEPAFQASKTPHHPSEIPCKFLQTPGAVLGLWLDGFCQGKLCSSNQ